MTTSPSSPDVRASDRVQTIDGPGVVVNVVRMAGRVTTLLVALDADAGRQPLWRSYLPHQIELEQGRLEA